MSIERSRHYNDTIELFTIFTNDKHEYRVKLVGASDEDSRLVPGPTTALGVLDKPLLVPWSAKMAVKDLGYYEKQTWTPHGYVRIPEQEQAQGFDRMVSIHNRVKTMEPSEYWEFLHQAKSAHRRSKEGAADIGSLVHKFVEEDIKWRMGRGEQPPAPTLPKVKEGAEAWLRWIDSVGDIRFTLSEQKIYSKRHRYAGTLDFACVINGVSVMGDLKTSNFFSAPMFWQVSAYQYARQEEFPDEHYEKQIIVRCAKDGALEVKESTRYDQSLRCFLACWIIWKEQKELKNIYK